jgi:hypothetical protein
MGPVFATLMQSTPWYAPFPHFGFISYLKSSSIIRLTVLAVLSSFLVSISFSGFRHGL